MIPGRYERGTYDETVYDVTVTVTNEADGLACVVAIRKEDQKFDTAAFTVAYSPLMKDVTVRKVWNDSGYYHPQSVEVSLLVDGEIVTTAVLSARNDWTCTWIGFVQKRDNSWKVQEKPIWGRYVASYQYDYEMNIATVTYTYTNNLIQTGQLKWPIPVRCVLGAALVGFGLYLVFKKRDDTRA